MASMVILVASLMISPSEAQSTKPSTPAVTMEKHVFTQGMNPMSDCRKMEASYHSGNGPIDKRGNKTITRVHNPSENYITETTTFCVEI